MADVEYDDPEGGPACVVQYVATVGPPAAARAPPASNAARRPLDEADHARLRYLVYGDGPAHGGIGSSGGGRYVP